MSRIDESIERLCPFGVPHKTLGDIGVFKRGGGPQKKDFVADGIGCIHYGQIYTHYAISADVTNVFVSPKVAERSRMAEPRDVVIAVTGENEEDLGKSVAWLGDSPVAVSNHTLIFTSSLNPKFVSYFLHSASFHRQKQRHITGAKVKSLPEKGLGAIRIPVPPLEVQHEIVRILDKFTELEMELGAELVARQKQYDYYRNQLLKPNEGAAWSTLGEASLRVSSGSTPRAGASEYYDGGTIPWLRTNEVRFTEIWDTEMKITERAVRKTAAKWIPEKCVIVAISGATAGRSAINMIPLTTNQHCCNLEINPAKANYRYVYQWVASRYEELKALGRGARSDLNGEIIKGFPIPLPPLNEQERIVSILDKFEVLINDLSSGLPAEISARRKQYEYYRDKLLTFKELPA